MYSVTTSGYLEQQQCQQLLPIEATFALFVAQAHAYDMHFNLFKVTLLGTYRKASCTCSYVNIYKYLMAPIAQTEVLSESAKCINFHLTVSDILPASHRRQQQQRRLQLLKSHRNIANICVVVVVISVAVPNCKSQTQIEGTCACCCCGCWLTLSKQKTQATNLTKAACCLQPEPEVWVTSSANTWGVWAICVDCQPRPSQPTTRVNSAAV